MKNRRLLITVFAVFLVLLSPTAARADNCGSFSDCMNVIGAVLAVLVGVAVFAALFLTPQGQLLLGLMGIIEAVTGRSLLTGEKLAKWEQVLGVLPLGTGLKLASRFIGLRAGGQAIRSLSPSARVTLKEAVKLMRVGGATIKQRREVLSAFKTGTLRIERVMTDREEYRYFGSNLFGRWTTPDFISNTQNRIRRLALPDNPATRIGIVTIPKNSIIFTGKAATFTRNGKNLKGGARQTFLLGDLNRYVFRERGIYDDIQ